MDASLNIVDLIENNPIINLSTEYNSRLVNKIKDSFTETQQHLFVSSFYCYLNYHPTVDFVIDLDDIWKWLGFSQKMPAKRLLENNFVLDKDYKLLYHKVKQTNETRGGHNKQTFLLNIRCFKLFCIKAGTEKANEIHEYFVKLEDIINQTVKEECTQLKEQLENQKVSSQIEKDLLREKTILEQFPVNTQCVYYGLIDDTNDNGEKFIKYGNSNHLQQRVEQHKKTFTNFRLVNAFKVDNKLQIENAIKTSQELLSYKRCIDIKDAKCTELLCINSLSFDKLDSIIKQIITSIEYSPENYIKLLNENRKLKEENSSNKTMFKKIMEENNRLKTKCQLLIDNHNNNTNFTVERVKKFIKQPDGFYYIHDQKYNKLSGTRQEVWDSIAYRTPGGLIKDDLHMNSNGVIVSKIKSQQNTIHLRPICIKHSVES